MKTAIDFYERGKQKEADADEYDRTHFYSKDRFICPECGEPVHLTGRKSSNYFAHFKKSDVSAECDRRVDGVPTNSIYERIGLPIYMRKKSVDEFELFMGFKALPVTVMNNAIKDSVSVKIDGKVVYRINNERFSCDATALIPIEYIPPSGMKYRIAYEPVNKSYAISQYWSDYADGFSYEGALFSVSEQGGKKVHHGDSITTDVEYYWVRRQNQLPSLLPGVVSRRCGRMILKGITLNVFCVTFDSNITDAEYNFLTSFLRNELRIHLLEKQPEFVPIWPPAIKTEEGYVTSETTQSIYGHIVSGNDIPRVFTYQGIQKIPEEVYANNKLISVRLRNQYTVINVDRKYVSNGTIFVKKDRDVVAFEKDIFEIIDSERVQIKDISSSQEISSIIFESNQLIDYILVHNFGQVEKYVRIGVFTLDDLRDGDWIFIVCNRNLISTIHIDINEIEKSEINIDDERLYKFIEGLPLSTRKVKIPYKLRLKLYDIRNQMPLLNEKISCMLKTNSIPLPLVKILGVMIDE